MRILKVAVYLVLVFVVGVILNFKVVDWLYDGEEISSGGNCRFSVLGVEGSLPLEDKKECDFFVKHGGADFVSFSEKEMNAKDYNRASRHVMETVRAANYLDKFSFPRRAILNHGHDLWISKRFGAYFSAVVYFFIVSVLTMMYLRRKREWVSYPAILLVSCIVVSFYLSFVGVVDNIYQFYVKIGVEVYLLSEIVYLFTFSYLFLYIVSAFIYHSIQLKRGIMTPLVAEIVVFVDRLSERFRL